MSRDLIKRGGFTKSEETELKSLLHELQEMLRRNCSNYDTNLYITF